MTKGTAFVLGTTTDVLLPQLLKIHNIPVMGNIFVLIWIAGLVYAIARYRLFTVTLATAAENVISTMSDCFILLDPQGTIQLVNKACPNVLRYTENELKGKPLTILLPSDQASNTHLREMMFGKELKNFYLTLKAKNGAQVPASLSTSILQDEEGNIAGIVWIARDITQHKLTEELLKEAEAKYSTFVERAKDGVAVVQDEVYRFVNRAMAEITGYTVQELLGRPMTELFASEDRDMISRRYRQRLAGEKVPSFYEAKFLAKDGTIKSVELSAAIIQYNERPADMLVIRDITERKGAEEEREKMRSQLFQSQKMEAIGLLAGGVAHDFNNMLTIIQGYNSLAIMKVEETNPLFSDLQQVEAAAKQAANLTRQLLIFSRKQPTVLTNLNLNKTIDNFSKMLLRLIGEDISVTIDLQPDLWLIRADEGNIEQVIMNLAVNARDAMPSGGQLTISTKNINMDEEQARMVPEAQPGQFVRLSISDTGIGMEREIINRIFEPFFTTKEIGRGTGLGLAVVYGIVKQHEGWVTVSSEPGQGTEFSLYFPACFLKREGEDEEVFSRQDLQGSGERILVVEDEEGVRTLITRVLQENGYLVFAASRAQEALTTFEKEKGNFHLIVSDVILPDLTGLELIDRLLLFQPKLKALLISGYANQKVQLPIIYERGYRFLQKPYTSIDLLRTIREIFTKS
ncbi:MAG: PAS domain S-box protein [bacterium]